MMTTYFRGKDENVEKCTEKWCYNDVIKSKQDIWAIQVREMECQQINRLAIILFNMKKKRNKAHIEQAQMH